jgi:hypothetical protein
VSEILEAIGDVYAQGDNGGGLHIVLDDGNVEDYWLAWCANEQPKTPYGKPLTDVERRCYDLLLPMSEQERGAVTAAYHGESSW